MAGKLEARHIRGSPTTVTVAITVATTDLGNDSALFYSGNKCQPIAFPGCSAARRRLLFPLLLVALLLPYLVRSFVGWSVGNRGLAPCGRPCSFRALMRSICRNVGPAREGGGHFSRPRCEICSLTFPRES